MARGEQYWAGRRKKQLGRVSAKGVKAFANPSVKNIAQAAWSGVKYLRTLVNSEVHKWDFTNTGTLSTTPVILNFTGIAQDDTASGRTGNSILIAYFAFRMSVTIHASATNSVVRCIIFKDKQQISDTAPTAADLLSITTNPLSFYNANKVGRFQVLSDKIYTLSASGAASVRYFKFYKKLNSHMRFNGSASTDIEKGGIYALLMSDQATNTPAMSYTGRIAWHDN
nr:capsid protein [Cressdnaviricota sp.]